MATLTADNGRIQLDLSREEAACLFALYSNVDARDLHDLFGVPPMQQFNLCDQMFDAGLDSYPHGFDIVRNPEAEVVRR